MDAQVMKMAALGRALYPGMLYDCRTDTFIPGVTLWDKAALRDDIDVHDQVNSAVTFSASDSLSEKANLLDVNASLKASFFSGLVEVGGSAKYMTDTKSSERQCRVTMKFSQTTKFEQLTMKNLGNVTYPQVFEQKTATHVVTAVLYGASAFMVFDYTAAENDRKQVIEGNVNAVIQKIPTISIDGEATVQLNEEEKKLSENINVTFYGDYQLEENPTTYQDALRVYKSLPSLLKQDNKKGVPVTVWLYPLKLLNSSAAKLEREVSLSLVLKAENVLEELDEMERKCNDLIKKPITSDFPDIMDRLLNFHELHNFYKIAFQRSLVGVLPGIRGGELENKALGDILEKHYLSPFKKTNMNQWLENIFVEIFIGQSYTSGLKDLTVVKSTGSFNSMLFDPDIELVVCLSFTSLKIEDSYLKVMKDFMDSDGSENSTFSVQSTGTWFTSHDISGCMRKSLSLFTTFYKVNKNEKGIKFVIASIHDPNNPGVAIRLYKHGVLNNPNFQPVSKPAIPTVQPSNRKAILKFSKSPTGETVHFRVEYGTSPSNDNKWEVTDTPDAQSRFSLAGLSLTKKYWVQYRAVDIAGMSEASDSVAFTLKAMSEDAMDPWDFMSSVIRSKMMNSISMSRWSLATIKSEMTNIVNSPHGYFSGPIHGGLKFGMAVYLQGVVRENGKNFQINILSPDGNQGLNVVLHMFYNLENDKLTYTNCNNGTWESAIDVTGCPLTKGSAFDVFFVMKSEGYEVYINGQRYYLFKHRLPTDNVNFFDTHGDLSTDIFAIIPNWNTSTFQKELSSGSSRQKSSDIQHDVPNPITKPGVNYSRDIPEGLKPGVTLFFQGVIPIDCTEVAINLKNKQTGNIVFHFNPRMNSVVINNCVNGKWASAFTIQGDPFINGGAFDLFLVVKKEEYKVIVNGQPFCTFAHRLPVDQVNEVEIRSDVFMNRFEIIKVDKVDV